MLVAERLSPVSGVTTNHTSGALTQTELYIREPSPTQLHRVPGSIMQWASMCMTSGRHTQTRGERDGDRAMTLSEETVGTEETLWGHRKGNDKADQWEEVGRDGTAKQRRGVGMDLLLILTGQANTTQTHTHGESTWPTSAWNEKATDCVAKSGSFWKCHPRSE